MIIINKIIDFEMNKFVVKLDLEENTDDLLNFCSMLQTGDYVFFS